MDLNDKTKSVTAMAKFTDLMKEKGITELYDHDLLSEMNARELKNLLLNLMLSIHDACSDDQIQRILTNAAIELEEDYENDWTGGSRMDIRTYAEKVLADHGCDCYTYGGEYAKHILDDLKEGYPDGMEFPYVDVANAILSISRPKPIVRSPWMMVFDTDDTTDGIGFDSFEAAQDSALEALVDWMVEAREAWKDVFHPTRYELDNYNFMICAFSVWVSKYNPDTDDYDLYWEPTNENEEEIGWKMLTMEDIQKER